MAFNDTKGEHRSGNGGNGKSKQRKSAAGRKGADKQSSAFSNTELRERLPELVKLKQSADEAAKDLNDAITVAAEKTGYLASIVRKVVTASAGEDFDGKMREAEQQWMAFEAAAE